MNFWKYFLFFFLMPIIWSVLTPLLPKTNHMFIPQMARRQACRLRKGGERIWSGQDHRRSVRQSRHRRTNQEGEDHRLWGQWIREEIWPDRRADGVDSRSVELYRMTIIICTNLIIPYLGLKTNRRNNIYRITIIDTRWGFKKLQFIDIFMSYLNSYLLKLKLFIH